MFHPDLDWRGILSVTARLQSAQHSVFSTAAFPETIGYQPSNFQPFATRLTFNNTGAGKFGTGGRLADPYQGLAGGDPFPYQGAYTPGGGILGIDTGFQWPYTLSNELYGGNASSRTIESVRRICGQLGARPAFAQDVNYP